MFVMFAPLIFLIAALHCTVIIKEMTGEIPEVRSDRWRTAVTAATAAAAAILKPQSSVLSPQSSICLLHFSREDFNLLNLSTY